MIFLSCGLTSLLQTTKPTTKFLCPKSLVLDIVEILHFCLMFLLLVDHMGQMYPFRLVLDGQLYMFMQHCKPNSSNQRCGPVTQDAIDLMSHKTGRKSEFSLLPFGSVAWRPPAFCKTYPLLTEIWTDHAHMNPLPPRGSRYPRPVDCVPTSLCFPELCTPTTIPE